MVNSSIPITSIFEPEIVSALRRQIAGDVYVASDEGYAEAIASWSLSIKHEPAIIVMPETTDDVARSVRFANEHDLPVAVQGAGHGQPVACVGGMLINTSRMQGVSIDPENQLARVEAGVRWSSIIPKAHEHGLAPLSGTSSGVGVVGYTLGGGYGWMARKYGRAADQIIAAKVVTASGDVLRLTEDSEPDLLRALKGGSGNFGIVTELEFGLVPVESVYGGSVMYPLEDAKRVFTAYNAWSMSLPDDITTSIGIMRFPPLPQVPSMLRGKAVVIVRACAVGNLAAGEAAIAPMRSLGTPLLDSFAEMPFARIDEISNDPKEPVPVMEATMTLRDLDETTIDALLEQVGPESETPLLLVDIRDLRTLPNVGGLPVFVVGVLMDADAAPGIQRAMAELREATRSFTTERVVLNFLSGNDTGPERTRAAYSDGEYAWLRKMKRRHDPRNRFRFNHNIVP